MKLFVRSIPVKSDNNLVKVDLLDLSDYKYAEIYKVEVSIDKQSDKALFYNITSDQIINGVTIPAGYYTIQQLISLINTNRSIISLITSEANKYHCKLDMKISFAKAKQLQEILGYPTNISIVWGVSRYCVNITRGLNVLQLYSSIVNSDSDTPLCTLKIDDPTKDFHDCIYTNCPIITTPINYIDIIFRDIDFNFVKLNAETINITLFIKAYNEMERIKNNVERSFNITTAINKLDNGKYSHKLDNSMNLTNGKIVNANFLLDGQINNITSEQIVSIDGIPYFINKGCYTLEQILSVMNSLSGAVFSYINSGEGCFRIQVENCSTVVFETPELANMLGFECKKYESANIVEKYQLTSNNNAFKLIVPSGSWILNVEPGIYNEQEFFKQLESAIRPYDSSIKIIIHEHYVEFNTNSNLLIDEYTKNKLQDYHWFKGFYKRNPETTNFTIARYNSFYFNETVTINRYLQYFFGPTYGHYEEKSIKANFSNGTYKSYIIDDKIRNNKWTKIDEIAYIIQSLIADHFDMTIDTNRSQFVFKSKDGVGVYFTQCDSLCNYLNLPTGSVTNFTMHMKNVHLGNMNFNNETLGFRLNDEQEWHDYKFDNTTRTLPYHMVKFRDYITPFVENITGATGGYLMYGNVFNVSFVVNGAIRKLNYIQFRGSLLDKGILKGFPTTKTQPVKMIIDTVFQNQHQINLGYTSCNELRDAIESKYELFNGKQTNPSLGVYLHDNSIKINDPYTYIDISTSLESYSDNTSALESYSFDDHNTMVLSNGYNNIYVDSDKSIILTIDSDYTVNYTLPAGCYTQNTMINKINSFIVNQGLYFIKRGTYYVLMKNNHSVSIDGDITNIINFVDTSDSIRIYYVDTAVIDVSSIYSEYPCNITNGFNLINVFTNIVETSANNDNYLTSFVIEKTSGKNVSAAGIKHNYANSNTPINRVIAKSNINQIDYYFTREDGNPFNINGKINCTLEINE